MIEPSTGLVATLRRYTRSVQLADVAPERFASRFSAEHGRYVVVRGDVTIIPTSIQPFTDPTGEKRAATLRDSLNRIYDAHD